MPHSRSNEIPPHHVPGRREGRIMSVNVIKEFCCFLTIQTVCQPVLRRAAQECPVRTSLDLELDLQASLTRQSRLNDELQALRGLRQKLEELKAQGETDLPPGVREDERFQKLLKEAEKQVQVSVSPLSLRDYIEPTFISLPCRSYPLYNSVLLMSSYPFPRTWNTFFSHC